MENIEFTIATKKNADEIFEFEKKCYSHRQDRFTKRALKHLIVSSTARTFFIRDENGVIYAVAIGLLRHFKIHSGRVYKIGVLLSHTRNGLGTAMIRKLEEWFKSSGMSKSCAEVRETNTPSRRMFEKNGYYNTKTLYCYYANDKTGFENGVKYWKNL